MSVQIEAGPVGNARDFDPAVGGLDLSIPTVVRIMCHLLCAMLPKSNATFGDTTSLKEEESSTHEISHGLIADNFLVNSLSQGQSTGYGAHLLLDWSCPQWQLEVSHVLEFMMTFVKWVYEMLNLSHLEFPDSEQTLSGVNFVSEAKADLGTSEWHFAVIELNKPSKIEEHSLCSLRSEIPLHSTGGTNLTGKHQIKRRRWTKVIIRIWCLHFIFKDAFVKLFGVVILAIGLNSLETLFFLWLHSILLFGLSFCEELFDVFVDKLVGSMTLSIFHILDHKVGKFVDVA